MRSIWKARTELAAAALTVAILAAGCMSGGSSYGSSGQPKASPSAQAAASTTTGALQVEQVDYRFQPPDLTAQAGDPVTVELVNHGSTAHTFTIDELNVDKSLDPGQTATVTFTPTARGIFEFYCRFHRSSGMTGSLTVSGAASSSSATPPAVPSVIASNYSSGY
jgi:nitrite reductase (NO-forming)